MSELKPVRCGCGGEAKVIEGKNSNNDPMYIMRCLDCKVRTKPYGTEAEAITAWNRAMGNRMELQTVKERTVKVEDLEKRSETSLSWEGICKNCGSYTMHEMNYCFGCGARLEWE